MTATDRLIGQVLGEAYRLKRRVATGTMGMIYEAEDLPRSRRVAVKLLHPSVSRDPAALATYRREAEAAGTLAHPHLVEYVDFSPPDAQGAYIVTELLEGEDLAARLQRVRRLGVRAAVSIAREMLAGLVAAHAAGVAHRNLKPTNVMLCRHGGRADFVKLVDFGLANLWAAAGSVTASRPQGMARYFAPEQAKGRPAAADARADVWATGVILYEMLAGAPAFAGPDRGAIAARIAEQQPPPLRTVRGEVRPELEAVVTRALAKAPGDRFASAAEMREALAAAGRLSGDWDEAAAEAPTLPPASPATLAALMDPFAEIHTVPQEHGPDSFKDPFAVMRTVPLEKGPHVVTKSWPPPVPGGAAAPPPVPTDAAWPPPAPAAPDEGAPEAELPHEPTMELSEEDLEAEVAAAPAASPVAGVVPATPLEPGLSLPIMRWWHDRRILGIAAAGLLVIVVSAVLIGRGCSGESKVAGRPGPSGTAPAAGPTAVALPASAPAPAEMAVAPSPADAAPVAVAPADAAPVAVAPADAAPAAVAAADAAAVAAAPLAAVTPPAARPVRPAAVAPARRPPPREEHGLPRARVRAVMAPLEKPVKACFRNFNITKGTATLSLTVEPSGHVARAVTVGKYAGSPAGGCAAAAARRAAFPSFAGKTVTISYSYDLR